MRLIDADEIKNRLLEMCKAEYDTKRQFDILTTLAIAEFIESSDNVPTIDPVKYLEENGYTVFKVFKKKSWLESKPCNDCQDDNYYCGGCERYYEWRERKS